MKASALVHCIGTLLVVFASGGSLGAAQYFYKTKGSASLSVGDTKIFSPITLAYQENYSQGQPGMNVALYSVSIPRNSILDIEVQDTASGSGSEITEVFSSSPEYGGSGSAIISSEYSGKHSWSLIGSVTAGSSSCTYWIRMRWEKPESSGMWVSEKHGIRLTCRSYQPPVSTYTITYRPGTFGSGTEQTAKKTQNVALALKDALFTRTGYMQTGWSKNRDGSTLDYGLGASYTTDAAVTLYPFWTANTYSLHFDARGGSGVMSDLAMTYDVASALPKNSFVKAGFTFAGWAASAGGNVAYADGESVVNLSSTQNAIVTLYAKWDAVPTYAVTYHPGADGSGEQQVDTKTQGTPLELKGVIFTRTGYTQTGWATSDGGAKEYDLGASYTANAPITLYPFWTPLGPEFTISGGVLTAVVLNGATSIEIPSTVTEIADKTFYRLADLKSVTIPSSVVRIGESAFWYCRNLDTVTFNEGLVEIGSAAFTGCRALERVKLPTSLEKIGLMAFSGTGLFRADIPANVNYIGISAFGDCPNLWMMTVDEDNDSYKVSNGGLSLVDKISETLVQVSAYAEGDFYVPDGIKVIGAYAFDTAEKITSVRIPASVARMGSSPFYYCSGIEAIYFAGNAPDYSDVEFKNLNATVYVVPSSTGWGVSIPGTWKGVPIKYAGNCKVEFEANGGTGAMSAQTFVPGVEQTLARNGFTQKGCLFTGWATAPRGAVVYKDQQSIATSAGMTLFAQWKLAAPTGLKASRDNPEKIHLEWDAHAAEGDVEFFVFRSEVNDQTKAQSVPNLSYSLENQFDDISAQTGVEYYYWIRASRTIDDVSDYSRSASGIRPTSAPPTPTLTGPGTIVVSAPVPLSVVAGDVLRMTFSRVGGSQGSIAVKAKTQTSTALMGVDGSADFDYVKTIMEWRDGDSSTRTIDIPTYIQPWEGTKMLRVKLSTLATGQYAGNLVPKLDVAKIYVDLENPSQFGTVSVEPEAAAPVAGQPLRLMFRRTGGSDWPIAVKYKVQTSTAIAGTDFEYMKNVLTWGDGESDEKVVEVPTYPSAAGKQLRVKLSTLTQGEYTGCVTPHVRNTKVYVPLR